MWSVPLLVVCVFSIFTIFSYHKRSSFGYSENRNYYHWLSVDERIEKLNSPIVLSGDPLFFPNAYRNKDQYFFRIDDENLENIYSQFSSKIQLVNSSQFLTWDSFILIGEKNSFENLNLSSFLATEIGKVHEKLPLLIKKFERIWAFLNQSRLFFYRFWNPCFFGYLYCASSLNFSFSITSTNYPTNFLTILVVRLDCLQITLKKKLSLRIILP